MGRTAHCIVLLGFALTACQTDDPEHLGKSLSDWTSQLAAESRSARLAAVRAIVDIARLHPESSDAETALAGAFSNEDSAVRYWAVWAAGEREAVSRRTLEGLTEAVNDPDAAVRTWAAYALCRHGRKDAGLPVLVRALEDSNGAVRLYAAHALEALGEEARPAVDALRSTLDDEFGYPARVAERILETLVERPAEEGSDR